MAGFSDLINGIVDKDGQQVTQSFLQSIDRSLNDDEFDSTKAKHKVERKIKNREMDQQNEQKVKFIKGEAKSAHADNPFENDEVTKLYVDSLKDIVGEVHLMTRDEMKNNMVRMEGLQAQIADSTADDLKEKDFLQEQYKKSYAFMQKEYEKRSAISTRAFSKIGELSEQYLDLQSMYSGLVNNNPVAMALFKVTSDVIGGYRKRKQAQKKMLTEDVRRQGLAKVLEKDKAKDLELEKKRNDALAAAQIEAAESNIKTSEEATPDTSEPVGNGVTEAFAGFSLPDDEYSNTGDAALSSEDMAGIFGATGGGFTRDHDAEAEAERVEAMEMMRARTASKGEQDIAQAIADGAEKLETREAAQFERVQVRADEDERENDEWESESREHQEKVIERMDRMIALLEKNGETFTKMSGGAGGAGGGGGLMGDLAQGALGVAGGGMLAKLGAKFAKPLTAIARIAAPVVAGGAAVLAKVGLGKVGAKMTDKFTGMTSKVLGGEVAKEVTKKGVEKVAKKEGIKGASKVTGKAGAKSAGKLGAKAIGKSLLKKIPGIGLLAGIGFGISRLMDGDLSGAGLEVLSGAASIIPGLGTAASVAIDASLVAKDMGAFESGSEEAMGLEKSAQDGEKGLEKVVAEKKRDYDKALEEASGKIPDPQQYMKAQGGTTNYAGAPAPVPPTYKPTSKGEGTFTKVASVPSPEKPPLARARGGQDYQYPGFDSQAPMGPDGKRRFARSQPGISAGRDNHLGIDMGAGAIASGLAPTPPTRATRPVTPDYTGKTPQVPMAGSSRKIDRFNEAQQYLGNASDISGVDAGTLAKITNIESGFNSEAQPISRNASRNKYAPKGIEGGKKGISSAHGYGQFLNATWEEQVKKHGSKYGVKGTGKDGAITSKDAFSVRQDKEVQAGMLAEYSKQGIALGEKYGAGNKDANVYAHHNLGPGGAKRLFKGMQDNPDARIEDVLKGDEIKNNPSLYKKGMSVSDAYQNLGKKMNSGDQFAQAMGKPSLENVLQPAASTATVQNLTPVPPKSMEQTGRLEQGIAQNNAAQEQKTQRNAASVAVSGQNLSQPSKQPMAMQDKSQGRTTGPSGSGSARNSDSTIQRLTDRWMSHGFA